jgi:hypothetical protein
MLLLVVVVVVLLLVVLLLLMLLWVVLLLTLLLWEPYQPAGAALAEVGSRGQQQLRGLWEEQGAWQGGPSPWEQCHRRECHQSQRCHRLQCHQQWCHH